MKGVLRSKVTPLNTLPVGGEDARVRLLFVPFIRKLKLLQRQNKLLILWTCSSTNWAEKGSIQMKEKIRQEVLSLLGAARCSASALPPKS